MPRKKLIRCSHSPYHITTKFYCNDSLTLPLHYLWSCAIKSLQLSIEKYCVQIHAFVLVEDHYHLILKTPHANIDSFMYYFNKNFVLLAQKSSLVSQKLLTNRYKWTLLKDDLSYSHVIKFAFRAPIKAGLCARIEDYPYSSFSNFPIRVTPQVNLNSIYYQIWLNLPHTPEQDQSIAKGLQKGQFKFTGTRENRDAPDFESI